ncbi:MAG: hypothetical protein M1834_007754 [Cirrosporium novae-zelandiae]|nr:MAG: hypothetical protein M1834_007754 [Cirrosporium novae-zelandiae]
MMEESALVEEEPSVANGEEWTTSARKRRKTSATNGPTRKRVSQACNRCRNRKDKCDGRRPSCSTCETLGIPCSYDPNTKKRGLPEGYVRGLEKLWALAIHEHKDIEETILEILGEDGSKREALVRIWNDEGLPEPLIETWKKSRILRQLERLLPILDQTDEKIGKRKRDNINLTQLSTEKTNTELEGNDSECRPSGTSGRSPSSTHSIYCQIRGPKSDYGSPQSQTQSASAKPRAFTLPSNTRRLLDIYFTYTHCWLPIIERPDVLRVLYKYSPTNLNRSALPTGSGEHATLWAILAYTKAQIPATYISHNPPTDNEADKTPCEEFYRRARDLIPLEDGTFELGHVQALLILSLYQMIRGNWQVAWLLSGHAVRIAIDLGLNSSSGVDLKSKSHDCPRNKHVFLGCFVLDTIISAKLCRRPHLRKDDVDYTGLVQEDGLEEWDPWNDCLGMSRNNLTSDPLDPPFTLTTFNRLVCILRILNEVTQNSATGFDKADAVNLLFTELNTWSQQQPPETLLSLEDAITSSVQLTFLPHQYSLLFTKIMTLTALQLYSFATKKAFGPGGVLKAMSRSARLGIWLLNVFSQSYNFQIAPPIFEYFCSVLLDCLEIVREDINNEQMSYETCLEIMLRSLLDMEKLSPGFKSLKIRFINSFQLSNNHQASRTSTPSNSICDNIQGPPVPAASPNVQDIANLVKVPSNSSQGIAADELWETSHKYFPSVMFDSQSEVPVFPAAQYQSQNIRTQSHDNKLFSTFVLSRRNSHGADQMTMPHEDMSTISAAEHPSSQTSPGPPEYSLESLGNFLPFGTADWDSNILQETACQDFAVQSNTNQDAIDSPLELTSSNNMHTTPTTPSMSAVNDAIFNLATPQSSLTQAPIDTLTTNFLDSLRFYNIGTSILYSISPAIHKAAFHAFSMPHDYLIYQTSSLASLFQLSQSPDFGGASISMPFKVSIVPSLTYKSAHVRAINAVNTLVPLRARADGTVPSLSDQLSSKPGDRPTGPVVAWYGENTDWVGILTTIKRHVSTLPPPLNTINPSSTVALVVGAGGVARAAIYALIQSRVTRIFLHNRTRENADRVAAQFNSWAVPDPAFPGTNVVTVIPCKGNPWPSFISPPTIIISCIPAHSVGGLPAANTLLPPSWLSSPSGGIVIDLAYQPVDTPLLKQVRSWARETGRHWITVSGLEPILEQAICQFEVMTGKRAPREMMRAEVQRKYQHWMGKEDGDRFEFGAGAEGLQGRIMGEVQS